MSSQAPIGISPRVDIVFRDIFGRPGNEDLLVELLNEVLQWLKPIVSVEILSPFSLGDHPDTRVVIVDLQARDSEGRLYQIEMQTTREARFRARVLFTWAAVYRHQLEESEGFNKLKPVISIWFCDENVLPASTGGAGERFHRHFELRDSESDEVLSDHLQIHVIELERLRRLRGAMDPEPGERWLRFLAEADRWPDCPEPIRSPSLEKAMSVLYRYGHDTMQREIYDARVLEQRRWATELAVRAEVEEQLHKEREEREKAERKVEELLSVLRAHGIAPTGVEGGA